MYKPGSWRLAVVPLILAPFVAADPAESSSRRARHTESGKKSPERQQLDIGKINDPNDRDTVGPHAQGEAVVRAGILLDRLKFSPGEIGDTYGESLGKAIAAFQAASGLPAVGSVDGPTWAALNDDQAAGHVEQKQGLPQSPPPPQAPPQPQPPVPSPPAPPGAEVQPPDGTAPDHASKSKQNQDQSHAGAQGQDQGKPPQGHNSSVNQPNQRPPNQTSPAGPSPPAIFSYTIDAKDVAGPFTHLPKVSGRNQGERTMLQEARLPWLNYVSALELLAERFHSRPHLLAQLNPGQRFHKAGVQIQVPNVLTPGPPAAASVVVDASTRSVTALDGSGKVLAFYPATVGSQHDPLPVGNWNVVEVTRNPKFKYNPNLFWDSQNKRPRATLAPGPRNPVGVVWIGLSKEHYGLHGTPDPSRIGQTYSHGCIRLTNWDASELAKMVHPGTPVLLEEGTPLHTQPQRAPGR